MFRAALKIAEQFTFPLVISRKTVGGECSSGVGTFVVINDEGWIVTAGHIISKWIELSKEVEATKATIQAQAAIKADKSLSSKERSRQFKPISKTANDRCSLWLTWPNVKLADAAYIPLKSAEFDELIDIGVGRLEPFDPSWVKTYPIFKRPENMDHGTSLCKLGFPFHQFTPTWDEAGERFVLPPGALPMPRFPIDGIFTRICELAVAGDPPPGALPPFPVKYIETSTPGLRGQSGGPTFDVHGTVWAIQAKTIHLKLGFRTAGPEQFLNVGFGVHPETMFGFFDEFKIKYAVSDY